MCASEGTRCFEGQASLGNTHHTEFGRKTGQLSVMVEAVRMQEFSCLILAYIYIYMPSKISEWHEQRRWKIHSSSIV